MDVIDVKPNSKKQPLRRALIIVLAALALVVLGNSFFILNENESAIVKRFGSIESVYVRSGADSVAQGIAQHNASFTNVEVYEGTGLHLKVPFVDNVIKYNNRLLTYDTPPRQVITSDKKKLLFDNNAQWQIVNPLLFDITMGSVATAETRIDDIIYSSMREKVGKNTSTDIISNRDVGQALLSELAGEVNQDLAPYGIVVFDVRIKRTDVPEENHQSIYNNMITERNRMAAQYRSEGEEQAIKTRSETDKQVSIILSEARAQSEVIRGEGDAEAAKIYNQAYGSYPEFYKFYNTLETYKDVLRDKVTLVLPNDSPFAQYLMGQ